MTSISGSDIVLLASDPGASSGYSTVTTTVPEGCLGKFCSRNVLTSGSLDNLFNDITGAENAAAQVDYQCIFVLNNTATGNSMLSPTVWIPSSSVTGGGATIQYVLDPTSPSSKTSGSVQAVTVSTALIAPSGVGSWTSPSATVAGGLSMPNLAPGYVQGIWIKRTATNSSAVNNDQFSLQVTFDTAG